MGAPAVAHAPPGPARHTAGVPRPCGRHRAAGAHRVHWRRARLPARSPRGRRRHDPPARVLTAGDRRPAPARAAERSRPGCRPGPVAARSPARGRGHERRRILIDCAGGSHRHRRRPESTTTPRRRPRHVRAGDGRRLPLGGRPASRARRARGARRRLPLLLAGGLGARTAGARAGDPVRRPDSPRPRARRVGSTGRSRPVLDRSAARPGHGGRARRAAAPGTAGRRRGSRRDSTSRDPARARRGQDSGRCPPRARPADGPRDRGRQASRRGHRTAQRGAACARRRSDRTGAQRARRRRIGERLESGGPPPGAGGRVGGPHPRPGPPRSRFGTLSRGGAHGRTANPGRVCARSRDPDHSPVRGSRAGGGPRPSRVDRTPPWPDALRRGAGLLHQRRRRGHAHRAGIRLELVAVAGRGRCRCRTRTRGRVSSGGSPDRRRARPERWRAVAHRGGAGRVDPGAAALRTAAAPGCDHTDGDAGRDSAPVRRGRRRRRGLQSRGARCAAVERGR